MKTHMKPTGFLPVYNTPIVYIVYEVMFHLFGIYTVVIFLKLGNLPYVTRSGSGEGLRRN